MSFIFAKRRLLPSLCLVFNRRLPNLSASILHNQYPGTSRGYASSLEESSNSNQNYYYGNNVPIRSLGAPDPSEGHPFQHWKDSIEEAIEEELNRKNFAVAVKKWEYFVQNTQSTHGIYELIEFALQNKVDDELKNDIEVIWEISRIILHASDFLAYLILSMIRTGHVEEATFFAKKFTVYGTSFIRPLGLMANKLNLSFVEQFGHILEEAYLKNPKREKTKKSKKKDEEEMEANKEMEEKEQNLNENALKNKGAKKSLENSKENKFQKLVWIWIPPKSKRKQLQQNNKKFVKLKLHKIDERKLEKLINIFIRFWVDKAVEYNNEESWERLKDFLARNRLKMTEEQEQAGKEAFCGQINLNLEREHERQLKFLFHPPNQIHNNNNNSSDIVDYD